MSELNKKKSGNLNGHYPGRKFLFSMQKQNILGQLFFQGVEEKGGKEATQTKTKDTEIRGNPPDQGKHKLFST